MLRRILPLTLLLLLPLAAGFAPPAEEKGVTYEGTVMMALAGRLTMLAMDGKTERTHEVASDAMITCDGKECRLEDLMKGYRVTVTTLKRDNKEVATKIEARKGQ